MYKIRYPLPEMPKYTKKKIKMTGIIHRLQQIMINENFSGTSCSSVRISSEVVTSRLVKLLMLKLVNHRR